MTRGIIGCVILALLLAAGLGVQWAVAALQAPITGELTQAAQAADHQPMEDVDSLFARLPAYGEDPTEFSACCRELARRVRAVYEAHSLTWWNLL